jgi:hypothetical protein
MTTAVTIARSISGTMTPIQIPIIEGVLSCLSGGFSKGIAKDAKRI